MLTRVNSPSDNNFAAADGLGGTFTFTTKVLNPSFQVANSVLSGGIHAFPNQFTGGQGPVTGVEVEFDVTFTTPFELGPDHVFFRPEVDLGSAGDFLWLSAPKPIVPNPFPRGSRTCSHGPATTAPARWRPIGRGSARISPIRGHSTPASR